MLMIGDRVTRHRMLPEELTTLPTRWDGTVVETFNSGVVRVYWRIPVGLIDTYQPDELTRVV
jgi:hypothetical protein